MAISITLLSIIEIAKHIWLYIKRLLDFIFNKFVIINILATFAAGMEFSSKERLYIVINKSGIRLKIRRIPLLFLSDADCLLLSVARCGCCGVRIYGAAVFVCSCVGLCPSVLYHPHE